MSTYETPSSVRWPIAAAMLPFPNSQEADPETWLGQLAQVAGEGFSEVDLTDTWLRIGGVEHYGGDGLTVSAENRDYIRRMLAGALGETRQRVLAKAAAL